MNRMIGVFVGCVAGIVALYRVFVATPAGQEADQAVMLRLAEVPASWASAAAWLGGLVGPVVAVTAVVLVLLAVLGRRGRPYGAALLALAGSIVTSEVLKQVLPRPGVDAGVTGNSFPSGHAAAIAAVAVVAAMLAPGAVRAAVAWIGGVAVAATGLAVVVLQWHRPSDVAAAILVAVGWGALASVLPAAVGRVRRAVTAPPPHRRLPVQAGARS